MTLPPRHVSRRAALALAAALFALPAAAQEGPRGDEAGPLRERVWGVPVGGHVIEVTTYKPAGRGPFPVVVMSHGSPVSLEAARRYRRDWAARPAAFFVARGFAVIVPMRRGYAASEGPKSDLYGSCAFPDYVQGAHRSAAEALAALDYFARDPEFDMRRVVAAGQSAGGWASLGIGAMGRAGIVGVVNFAGGRGGRPPNTPCAEDKLVEAAGVLGRTTRVPALWLYAENDRFFRPELVQRMFAAYQAAGARARFVPIPAFRQDGHGFVTFPEAQDAWQSAVGPFLAEIAPPGRRR
jgi:dienelactone hydrolase